MRNFLKSYFFWTHPRGSFHYDVLVTLILVFLFVSPRLWNYGDKPIVYKSPAAAVTVTGDGSSGLIFTVPAANVDLSSADTAQAKKKILRRAIEPISGDAVSIDRYEAVQDDSGQITAYKVWAHR